MDKIRQTGREHVNQECLGKKSLTRIIQVATERTQPFHSIFQEHRPEFLVTKCYIAILPHLGPDSHSGNVTPSTRGEIRRFDKSSVRQSDR